MGKKIKCDTVTLLRYDYSVCFVTYLVVFYRHYRGKMYLFCKVREAGLCPEGCWVDPQNRQGKDAVTHIMNTGRYLAFVHFHSLPPQSTGPLKTFPFFPFVNECNCFNVTLLIFIMNSPGACICCIHIHSIRNTWHKRKQKRTAKTHDS